MNNLELLKDKQEIVYKILNNSLVNQKLSHAYMFTGPKGSLQLETAYLLAQSVVCENGLWACGICDQCQRILENTYPDFIILDGQDHLIKKEEVLDLQQKFSLTAFEESAYKIFMIKDAHKMTASAANSLLKFLEEPSDHVLGILISDDVESLLPTIMSRCTNLNFKSLSFEDVYRLALNEGMDERDAYYYSMVVDKSLKTNEFLEDVSYLLFKSVFERFINALLENPDRALYIIQNELLKHSNKAEMNEAARMFLDMLIVFLNDAMSKSPIDGWYAEVLNKYHSHMNYLELLAITLETKNKVASHINMPLLMDQMMFKYREVL